MKIYLAGPDVFRENAIEHFENLKKICQKWGLEGHAPTDNFSNLDSKSIFEANIAMLKTCDIVVANLTPFRGAGVDDGTAVEIGYALALGKKIWGYSDFCNLSLKAVTNIMFDINHQEEFSIVEDFSNPCNLMIVEAIKQGDGEIFKTFEQCIESIHNFYNLGSFKDIAEDTDFIDYLIIKRLKNIVVKCQAFEKGALLRDEEKNLDEILANKYGGREHHELLSNLNLNTYLGVECHPLLFTAENFRKYALKLFELNILETSEYKKEKDRVLAILREKQITEIFNDAE